MSKFSLHVRLYTLNPHSLCAAMMCCTSPMGTSPGRVARRR
ncbi:MAG: hypothetical protein ABI835_12035 [Chloroflexota bacterium]